MKYLYMDNFRGFKDTLIPLKPANFLVGENSTGKTSILALISLLSTPNFWFNQSFNTNYYDFGGFKDIVSVNSEDKTKFNIGMLDVTKRKDKEELNCLLMTFKKHEGLPIIYRLDRVAHDKHSSVLFLKSSIQYKIEDIASNSGSIESIHSLFRTLLESSKKKRKGFKQLNIPFLFLRRTALAPIHTILDYLEKEKKPDLKNMTLSLPAFTSDLAWIAPIRSKPKRTYDGYSTDFSPEGEHTPYLLRRKLNSKSEAEEFKKVLESFGKASGLFKQVKIKNFGRDASSPFEVHILLSKSPLRINSVGYGVSQALPVVIELIARSRNTWFAIQQPEVHLHPKAQAALGDLLFELMQKDSKSFIIETHSDYTIDRFRLNYRHKQNIQLQSQVIFFERTAQGNKVHILDILQNGEYPEDQPVAFRDFFIKEQMNILGL